MESRLQKKTWSEEKGKASFYTIYENVCAIECRWVSIITNDAHIVTVIYTR